MADRVRKKAKKRTKKFGKEVGEAGTSSVVEAKWVRRKTGNAGPRRRAPRSAAISIKKVSQELSYADILRKVRTQVSMSELRITSTKIRKAANGAVIIEIPGENGKNNAEKLKGRLKQVFGEDEAQISRPEIKGDLRIVGFDDSVLPGDIGHAIRTAVKCDEDEIKVEDIRPMKNCLFIVAIAIQVAALTLDCMLDGQVPELSCWAPSESSVSNVGVMITSGLPVDRRLTEREIASVADKRGMPWWIAAGNSAVSRVKMPAKSSSAGWRAMSVEPR